MLAAVFTPTLYDFSVSFPLGIIIIIRIHLLLVTALDQFYENYLWVPFLNMVICGETFLL